MIQSNSPPSSEYYVIFTQGVTHWVSCKLKPNFSHVVLITRDEYNWIVLNPTRLYLQVIIPPVLITDSPLPMFTKPDDTVLHMTFDKRDDTQQYGAWGLFNCVTWAKYILGLRILCFTPWRLYNRLLNFKPDDFRKHGIRSIKKVDI
jgi:hypothetical protein